MSFRPLPGQLGHIDNFATYVSDVSVFLKDVVKVHTLAPGSKKVLLAHSMGGQIALRYLLENSEQNPFSHVLCHLLLFACRVAGSLTRMQF